MIMAQSNFVCVISCVAREWEPDIMGSPGAGRHPGQTLQAVGLTGGGKLFRERSPKGLLGPSRVGGNGSVPTAQATVSAMTALGPGRCSRCCNPRME